MQWATTSIITTQAYQAEEDGELLTALESFEQAIGMSPDEAWLHCERGRLLMELEAYEEARGSLQACLELSHDDPGTREWAEALLEELGSYLP